MCVLRIPMHVHIHIHIHTPANERPRTSQASGREMMVAHLNQYMDPSVSEDTEREVIVVCCIVCYCIVLLWYVIILYFMLVCCIDLAVAHGKCL